MKRIKILILSLIISLLSLPSWSNSWSETFDDLVEINHLYYKKFANVPFTGEIVGRYSRNIVNGNFKDGKEHGLWKLYYENGQLGIKVNFNDGKKDRVWEYYRQDGQLEEKRNYKDGENHGLWERYYWNGKLSLKGNYTNGYSVGLWKKYCGDGKLSSKGNYTDGKEDGVWEWYQEDNSLDWTETWKNGHLLSTTRKQESISQNISERLRRKAINQICSGRTKVETNLRTEYGKTIQIVNTEKTLKSLSVINCDLFSGLGKTQWMEIISAVELEFWGGYEAYSRIYGISTRIGTSNESNCGYRDVPNEASLVWGEPLNDVLVYCNSKYPAVDFYSNKPNEVQTLLGYFDFDREEQTLLGYFDQKEKVGLVNFYLNVCEPTATLWDFGMEDGILLCNDEWYCYNPSEAKKFNKTFITREQWKNLTMLDSNW